MAQDARTTNEQEGIAYYNAARAHHANGDLAKAAIAAENSRQGLPIDSDVLNPVYEEGRSRRARQSQARWVERQAFKRDRAALLAQIYRDLADGDGGFGEACESPRDCAARGLSVLEEDRRAFEARVAGAPAPDPQWQERFFVLRGALQESREDFDEAIDTYKQVRLISEPGSARYAEAGRAIGRISLTLGEKRLSEAQAAAATTGQSRYAATRFEDAADRFRQALDVMPSDADTRERLLEALLGRTKLAGGESAFAEAEALSREINVLPASASGAERAKASAAIAAINVAWAERLTLSSRPTQDATRLAAQRRQVAITQYQAAERLDPSNTVYKVKLGDLHTATRDFSAAYSWYRRAIGQLVGQPDWAGPTGEPGEEFARQARRQSSAVAEILRGILQATRLNAMAERPAAGLPGEIDVLRTMQATGDLKPDERFALADLLLGAGQAAQAQELVDYQESCGSDQPIHTGPCARAAYLASRLDLIGPSRNTSRAARLARLAAEGEPEQTEYRLQSCVADILDGSVFKDGGDSLWCVSATGLDGRLLQGIHYLRKAQFQSAVSRRRDERNKARNLFQLGQLDLETEPRQRDLRPTLPLPMNGQAPIFDHLFVYGDAIAAACAGVNSRTGLSSEEREQARMFFDAFDVAECQRSRN